MKMITAYSCIWISCALAVSVAIYITESAIPLWALIIPGLISMHSDEKEGEDE